MSTEDEPRRGTARWSWLPLLAGVGTGAVFRLLFNGGSNEAYDVMMSAFALLVPVVVGVVTVYVAERISRRSWGYYIWAPALANTLFVLGFFFVYIEGLICTVLALPLFAILGGVAGLLTGAVCRWSGRPRRVLSVAALPLVLGAIEQHVPLPNTIETVTNVRLIEASPADVWQVISFAPDIAPEELGRAWMYRIGVPLPLSAVTELRGGERVRHIEMGKGIHFDQVVVDWRPSRRVEWTYRFAPDSFPPRALDDHVRIGGEHFDLIGTAYTLESTDSGNTRVTAEMTYRVSTHFNAYARLVARLLVSDFEKTALEFYARRAEAEQESPSLGDNARAPQN